MIISLNIDQNIKAVAKFLLLLFLSFTTLNTEAQEISCNRKISFINSTEAIVEILITKNTITGFGKIEEQIPAGFKAKANEKNNGVFSFVDGKVKYLWMELPIASSFKVSYKVTGSNINTIKLDGNFSYLINDQSFKTTILTVDQLPVTNSTSITSKTTSNSGNNMLRGVDAAKQKNTAKPEKGTVYKVQIGAFKQSKWEHTYTNIKNLSSDKSGEFTRYYSGNFKSMEDAKKHQNELAKKGYVSTFVVYFVNGVRYTVNE